MTWKDEIRKDLGDAIDRRERSMDSRSKLIRGLVRTKFELMEMHEKNPAVDARDYYIKLFEKVRDYNRDNGDYDENKIIEFYDKLAGLEFEARDVAEEILRLARYVGDYGPEGE